MTTYENAINQQYSRPDLKSEILSLLQEIEARDALTRDDIASFDEFHIRGRTATRELARRAELNDGMSVLDLGSGLGGPARTLAAERGCHVVGVDLTEAYVQAAMFLTERVGLDDRVTFQQANVLNLPFEESSFDAVWLQHVSMNVDDKPTLFHEAHRVLRPAGRLVMHEIGAGSHSPLHYPVPWADEPSLSFLVPPNEMHDLLEETGFSVEEWSDTSSASLDWFRETFDPDSPRDSKASTPLLSLLMGKNASQKRRNVVRNLDEDRIAVIEGIARRRDE